MSAAEIQNIGRRRSSIQASLPSERALSPFAGVASAPSGPPVGSTVTGTTESVLMAESLEVSVMGDPRVQEAVQDVDQQVDEQVDQHQDGDRGDHGRAVL